jgi:hypothetical protein
LFSVLFGRRLTKLVEAEGNQTIGRVAHHTVALFPAVCVP